MKAPTKHVSIVISPLAALISDQIRKLSKHGIRSIEISKKTKKRQKKGTDIQ